MASTELRALGRPTELRLALVCYGGVSLAVYMHGVTKELHKLARASRAFDELDILDGPNPFAGAGADPTFDSEAAYFEALRHLARNGRRLSVSIDIIAGTSAGGINGVVLAKALAINAEQEVLKRLWIDEGDLKSLLRTRAVGGVKVKAFFAVMRQLRKPFEPTSPLRGEKMSKLLLSALEDMDRPVTSGDTPRRATLLPENGEIQLFVTMTDLNGFEILVPSGAGGASQRDQFHAQVLEFRGSSNCTAEFGSKATPALAFSARATASFPGAFAPVSADSFSKESGTGSPVDVDRRFRYTYSSPTLARGSWFADGGILDNAPFDHVINAIKDRRAETEVERRLVYIQPDPGRPLIAPAEEKSGNRTWIWVKSKVLHTPSRTSARGPGWLTGLVQAVGVVKGSHPILVELLKLRDINERIAQIGSIVDAQTGQVEKTVQKALGALLPSEGPAVQDWYAAVAAQAGTGPGGMAEAAAALRKHATQVLGPAWPTYQRLKVEAVAHRLAAEVCRKFSYPDKSIRYGFVRAATASWATRRSDGLNPASTQLAVLLGPADIPYRERRILFLLAGVNKLYDVQGPTAPSRDDLNSLKTTAWTLLERLRRVPVEIIGQTRASGFLGAASIDDMVLTRPDDFASRFSEEFGTLFNEYRTALAADTTIKDGGADLWQTFERVTGAGAWAAEHRNALLTRYLGFPIWDGIIFPTISLAELPQFTPIPASQFSPLEAATLTPLPQDAGKLKGTSFAHFSGFFNAAWRENDYLWGRLDAAELILRTLRETSPDAPPTPAGSADSLPPLEAALLSGGILLTRTLRAILTAEGDLRAGHLGRLRDSLSQQVADLEAELNGRG